MYSHSRERQKEKIDSNVIPYSGITRREYEKCMIEENNNGKVAWDVLQIILSRMAQLHGVKGKKI